MQKVSGVRSLIYSYPTQQKKKGGKKKKASSGEEVSAPPGSQPTRVTAPKGSLSPNGKVLHVDVPLKNQKVQEEKQEVEQMTGGRKPPGMIPQSQLNPDGSRKPKPAEEATTTSAQEGEGQEEEGQEEAKDDKSDVPAQAHKEEEKKAESEGVSSSKEPVHPLETAKDKDMNVEAPLKRPRQSKPNQVLEKRRAKELEEKQKPLKEAQRRQAERKKRAEENAKKAKADPIKTRRKAP